MVRTRLILLFYVKKTVIKAFPVIPCIKKAIRKDGHFKSSSSFQDIQVSCGNWHQFLQCKRLPGFIGPIPPPLWIRFSIFLSPNYNICIWYVKRSAKPDAVKQSEKAPACCKCFGGGGRIRTIESWANRFTVCPLWPLGYSPVENFTWQLIIIRQAQTKVNRKNQLSCIALNNKSRRWI